MDSWYSVSVGNRVEDVGCCRSVKASSGGEGTEIVGCVMRYSDVWVMFCLALVSMALGAVVIWGRGGRGFVVGVR